MRAKPARAPITTQRDAETPRGHQPACLSKTGGTILTNNNTITVRLDRRAYSPVLRSADLPDATVPWWGDRRLHFEYADK